MAGLLDTLADQMMNTPSSGGLYPGAFTQPPAGGGMIAEQGLGLVNPALQSLSGAFGLNEQILRTLVGPGAPHYGGSASQPTNHANILLNQWQSESLRQITSSVSQQQNALQQRFLHNMYSQMGFGDDTSRERAKRDMEFMFSPGNLISSSMLGGANIDRLGLEMERTAMTMGVRSPEVLLSPFTDSKVSPADARALRKEHRTRVQNMRQFNEELMNVYTGTTMGEDGPMAYESQYPTGPSAFGGLTGGEAGSVMSWMARSGGISEKGMNTAAGRGQMVERVRKMSTAVGTMKELFEGPIEQLMEQLDSLFGGRAGAIDPTTVHARLLQFKHTAAATGQSLGNLSQMSGVGQQYMQHLGAPAGAGFQVALDTAALLGSDQGQMFPKLNMQGYRENLLKFRAGAHGSSRARHTAGAYLSWLDKKGFEDTAERQGEFRNMLESTGSDIKGLASATGLSVADIARASESEDVLSFTEESGFGADVAMEGALRRAEGLKRRTLSRRLLKRYGIETEEDIGTMSYADINKLIEQQVAPGQRVAARGVLTDVLGGIGGQLGFTGPRAHFGFEQFRKNYNEMKQNRRRIQAGADFESAMERLDRQGFGLMGVFEAVATADEGGEEKKTLGELAKSFLGMGDITKNAMHSFRGLMTEDTQRGALSREANVEILQSLKKGTLSEKGAELLKKSIEAAAEQRPNDAADLLKEAYMETEAGKKVGVIERAGLLQEYQKNDSFGAREKLIRRAAIREAARGALGDDTARMRTLGDKLRDADTTGDRLEAIKSVLTDKQYARFEKEYSENKDLLGIKGPDMQEVLQKLTEAVEKFVRVME